MQSSNYCTSQCGRHVAFSAVWGFTFVLYIDRPLSKQKRISVGRKQDQEGLLRSLMHMHKENEFVSITTLHGL